MPINTPPLIIAHRGASAAAPENTLAAFALAMETGADGIELDVRLSRDGVPVVMHDETLHRTGLRGESVASLTAKQLSEVDVGSWFNRTNPQHARAEYAGERVPALNEVFQLFWDLNPSWANQNPTVYVEMKTSAGEDFAKLTHAVARLIPERNLHSRVVVVSFDLAAIARIKTIDQSIRTGALFEPRHAPTRLIRKREMISAAGDSGAEQILLHRSLATPRAVGLALENNLSVVVWTVDDPGWRRRAPNLGIHALITNDPAAFTAQALAG